MSNEATRVRRDPVRLTLRMFARVFGEGLTPELKNQLFELPEFRDLLSGRESCNAEAEHQTVLGFNVFPVGTFYLKTIADTIHPHVDLIHACYEESGMETSDLDAIDHISAELTFLSSCGDDHLRTLFIDRHLIGWLPIFTTALRRHGNPLYQRVSELTLLLVLDLRRNLAGPISPALLPGVCRHSRPRRIRYRNPGCHRVSDVSRSLWNFSYPSVYSGDRPLLFHSVRFWTTRVDASVRFQRCSYLRRF